MPQTTPKKPGSQARQAFVEKVKAELQIMWRSMTKERLIDFLKTMVWVAPLTVLIWVYAEQQQVQSVKGITAAIEVKDGNPNDLLYLTSPAPTEGLAAQEGVILVDISGSQNAVDRVEQRLRDVSEPVELNLPSQPAQDVPYSWETKTYLENNPIFAGVDITGCNPPTLQVRVDQMVRYDIPVEPPTDVPGLTLAQPNQDKVKISGPKKLLDSIDGDQKKWVAKMDLAGDPILSKPGTHAEVAVRLLPPVADENVKLIPDTIMAKLVVGNADVDQQFTGCDVYVEAPASVVNSIGNIDYQKKLETPQTFEGPKEVVTTMSYPTGVIQLLPADVLSGGGPKPVSFPDLPPGVKYIPPPDGPPIVQVHITPK